MPTETLARLLRESADLAPIRKRLEAVRHLQRRYRCIVPEELVSSSRICAVEGTVVVVRADNAPVAAALRAMAPRLLAKLKQPAEPGKKTFKFKLDQELTGLRVEVQVASAPVSRPARPRGALPVEKLAELAQALSPSPLKEVLDRVVGAQRKRRTRSKM